MKPYNRLIFIGIVAILGAGRLVYAQEGDMVPPPLNPFDSPWPSPSPEGSVPPQGGQAPDVAPPPSFPPSDEAIDPFEDDDYSGGGGFGSSGRSGGSTGKKSFMLLESESEQECSRWTHELDAKTEYPDRASCIESLNKGVRKSKETIDNALEHFNEQKNKSVIQGEMTRADSKSYKLNFDELQKRVEGAGSERCSCVK